MKDLDPICNLYPRPTFDTTHDGPLILEIRHSCCQYPGWVRHSSLFLSLAAIIAWFIDIESDSCVYTLAARETGESIMESRFCLINWGIS